MATPSKARLLYLDLERAPSLGYVWGKWEQDVLDFEIDWYILTFAYKWQGEAKIYTRALSDYALFKRDHKNDRELVKELWGLFNEADIIVAHHGDGADIPWSRTRFAVHGLTPPAPFRTVDTKKLARGQFKFDSNKLDELGRCLGLGRKLPNTGFDLWNRCMNGERKAFEEMRRYNAQDVALLEAVYLKLRAWSANHPPMAPGEPEACSRCGSTSVRKQGFAFTAQRKRQKYQCQSCGGWFMGPARRLDASA